MTDDERRRAARVVRAFAINIAGRAEAVFETDRYEANTEQRPIYETLRIIEHVALAAADVIEDFGDEEKGKKRTGFQ
jgi:hypothetical protein